MATRPTVGGSDGTWGTELNTHLDVSLDADGRVDDGAKQTTTAAPTSDAELANKKYVDDQIDAITDPTYSGGESHTLIGGLIIKMGKIATGATTGTLTFGAAFPTALLSITLGGEDAAPDSQDFYYMTASSASAFSWSVRTTDTDLHWIAMGY